jgi:multiple antibiotic resistance protein
VMVYSAQMSDLNTLILAILLAWIPAVIILLASSWMQRLLGRNIMLTLERLMGFIMSLFAVNLFFEGLRSYLQS